MNPPQTYSEESVERRRALGVAGEKAAARWYVAHGFTVLDRNWRCRDGELDLVVAHASLLVFCEVKTRSSTEFGVPAAAVTTAKQRRIRSLAVQWMAAHACHAQSLRFDVASVVGMEVEMIAGAF